MEEESTTIITALAWGSIEVTISGCPQQFRDCVIWPGGAREWNWRETGTEHNPGIQPADIAELLEKEVEVVILAQGVFNRLGIQPETETILKARNIECHLCETHQAVDLFNDLSKQGKRVGGLFHTTC